MPEGHGRVILVTGGTGTTGGRLAALLCDRGAEVRTASRHPKAVTVGVPVHFDWQDASTYRDALGGVERVYLLRPPCAEPLAPLKRFLEAANGAGVRRAVLLHSTVTGVAGMPEIADAVRDAMPEWAILRASWFMQNVVGEHPTARAIREHDEIATATGDGRVGFVDAMDIAATAAELLLSDAAPSGDYVLSGPEALSYQEVAAIIADVSGRPVRHVSLSAEQMVARWIAAGLPKPMARVAAEIDAAIGRGEQDFTTTTVADVTGRPPRSFRDFALAHRAAWRHH